MIKVESKPHKTVQFFSGSFEFDVHYTFEVVKSVNGEKKYSIENISPTPPEFQKDSISEAILKWCEKNGVGDIMTNQNA